MDELKKLININITGSQELITPEAIKRELPADDSSLSNVLTGRQVIQDILDGKDKRKFIVVGPCSIHDPKAAHEYAEKLKALAKTVEDKFYLVMRVYFEKPRTTTGWKGLINDPYLDDSFHIEEGLKIARGLLLDFAKIGLPSATEALDPITPQYLSELISWSAIGARTTESQTHREMSSGLSMPVGIKNGTDGTIEVAINALKSVKAPHHFLGISQEGKICKFSTRGNQYAHIVLRGGDSGPNYDEKSIKYCAQALADNGLRTQIVVDCSHANSNKDHNKQPEVFMEGIRQIKSGNENIVGFMLESNLNAGNQSIPQKLSDLKYGVSITDKCIDWPTTEKIIQDAAFLL